MAVEVVIPWRGGCEHRERALKWLTGRLPYPIRLAECPAGEWCKGAALYPAVEDSDADIIVMHDADVWSDGLELAIQRVEGGEPWAIPHRYVQRLTRDATANLIDGLEPHLPSDYVERYEGVWGGGILVLPRETYLRVPIDGRFVGWGQEDISWANALWFLAGEGWRGQADLVHLWHPPAPRLTRDIGSAANKDLAIRYRQARRNPSAIRALADEGRLAIVSGATA